MEPHKVSKQVLFFFGGGGGGEGRGGKGREGEYLSVTLLVLFSYPFRLTLRTSLES